jgi:hypothetical protein
MPASTAASWLFFMAKVYGGKGRGARLTNLSDWPTFVPLANLASGKKQDRPMSHGTKNRT